MVSYCKNHCKFALLRFIFNHAMKDGVRGQILSYMNL